MQLSDIDEAFRVKQKIASLHATRQSVLTKGALGITIGGQYQDEEMVSRLRGHVVAILEARICEQEHILRELGVELPPEDKP